MSLLQEMEKYGLADCEFNRKLNSISVLENSISWQKHILAHSQNQKQRERARRAIVKLEEELQQAKP